MDRLAYAAETDYSDISGAFRFELGYVDLFSSFRFIHLVLWPHDP